MDTFKLPGWFKSGMRARTAQEQAEAEFELDAAVGMAPARRVLSAPTFKVSRAAINEYEQDAAQRRRHERIVAIRHKNQRG